MNAWADGLNYYLVHASEVTPRVITHFEPWMALTFSEGSIGGDIERVNLNQLEAFYGRKPGSRLAVTPVRLDVMNAGGTQPLRRADRLERRRHRAVEHQRASRAAADQPAHVVLLPLRAADDERRRA